MTESKYKYVALKVPSMDQKVQEIVNEIETDILEGRLQPGDTLLPTARAEAIGKESSHLNLAYRFLRNKGLITSAKGRGTWVK